MFEKYKTETSKKPSLRAFFSEAVSCLQKDRFGKERLAMTSRFFIEKMTESQMVLTGT
jgi:hypothetical protein